MLGRLRRCARQEYSDYRYRPIRQLTVDTCAARHPGEPSRQSIQSVAVRLIRLCLQLEHGFDSEQATAAIQQAASRPESFVWLDPPTSLDVITVLDVQEARDLPKHTERVERWARSVWEAWVPYWRRSDGGQVSTRGLRRCGEVTLTLLRLVWHCKPEFAVRVEAARNFMAFHAR